MPPCLQLNEKGRKIMALTKELKTQIIKEYQVDEKDTGSVEVQVALLTYEINELNAHLQQHPKDFHSKRGLFMKIGHRRSLLGYLRDNDVTRYQALIQKLGLRR